MTLRGRTGNFAETFRVVEPDSVREYSDGAKPIAVDVLLTDDAQAKLLGKLEKLFAAGSFRTAWQLLADTESKLRKANRNTEPSEQPPDDKPIPIEDTVRMLLYRVQIHLSHGNWWQARQTVLAGYETAKEESEQHPIALLPGLSQSVATALGDVGIVSVPQFSQVYLSGRLQGIFRFPPHHIAEVLKAMARAGIDLED